MERAPSPPRSRYDESGDSDRSYRYEERTRRSSNVVAVDPRYSQYPAAPLPLPGAYPQPSSSRQEEAREEVVQNRYGDQREKQYYNDPKPDHSRYPDSYKYAEGDLRSRDELRRHEEEIREKKKKLSINLPGGIKVAGGISVGRSKSPRPQFDRPESPTFIEKVMKKDENPLAYGLSYEVPKQYEYAKPNENLTYSRACPGDASRTVSFEQESRSRNSTKYRVENSEVVTVEPGRPRHQSNASPGYGSSLTAARSGRERDPSPRPHSLSVSSPHGAHLSLAAAPGSPLLESYHGTYQSISPMPSPMLLAISPHETAMEPFSPLSSDNEGSSTTRKKRHARFHDPRDDAESLAKALKGEKRSPDLEPLIELLPALTHKQMLDLRAEYKKLVKTGPEKKGVNIAKHVKMRLKEADPALMKACYTCALGQWESEAYWANFWYHGEKSNRELLIESLMGRTNAEVRAIKDGFSDKKYGDSLVKCMKTELKEDKFKKAVLLVLEERRMEDYGPDRVDRRQVEDDVYELHKALRSEKGGETAMIQIVVLRSDSHLRECLRAYEETYRANFAREMLKKSGNLVGELLAHILNGVINRPVRDALLLHQALSLSSGRRDKDNMRTELLISRLVRYHWDRFHIEAVKKEYKARYNMDLITAVRDETKGDWGRFCEQLCLRRMPDEVREIRRVAY